MNKVVMFAMCICVAMSTISLGQNIYVSKSQERTAEDLPLTYKEEKTVMDGNWVQLIGTVKNTSQVTYKYVQVIFTASKSSGGFIARDSFYTEPLEIGPGQVGFIKKRMETNGEKPGKIEWIITGQR